MIRVGQGYDVHPFAAGRKLVLGGVEIACARGGLAGHSDADVLAHAVASALLGSLALGDMGMHFPDTDARWKGASSLELLRAAHALVTMRGFAVQNVDATVVAEEPRLGPHVPAMRTNLARILQIEPERVSVKATTHEKVGALGRAEGIAAHAVVLVASQEV
jgi:2-C-methyl-D-erythritol 2,4-cyclodiphosphate synthase